MIFKKIARFIWCLFFPPVIYKEKKLKRNIVGNTKHLKRDVLFVGV